MDLSSIMQTMMSKESIENVSTKTGASATEVRSVLFSALPMLLSGANSQAANNDTSDGFTNAVNQHSQNSTASLTSFFQNVDLTDGAKIIGHLLGKDQEIQTQTVSEQTGVSNGNTSNILAAVAPLLMSLIGQQVNSESNGSNISGLMNNLLGSVDMTSIIGGFLSTHEQDAPVEETDDKPNQSNGGLLGSILGLFK